MSKENASSNQEKTVIFIHILKTGGTTLIDIIRQNYKQNVRFAYYGKTKQEEEEFKQNLITQSSKVKFLLGHIPFGWHNFLTQPFTYITFLRNPIDRIVSFYYYLINRASNMNAPLAKVIVSQNMSLKDFVCSNTFKWVVDNQQTRLLVGSGKLWGKDPQKMLETAKENVEKYFTFVGFTERFDESLILLKKKLEWQKIFYLKKNVTPNKPAEIPKETLDIIKKHNQLDIELYRYLEKKFNELIKQQNPLFENELKIFQLQNAAWQEHLDTMEETPENKQTKKI